MAPRAKGKRTTRGDGEVVVVGKNANGAGSVYRVGDSYKAAYVDPSTGKRRTVSGRTKAEAEDRRAQRLDELARRVDGPVGIDPTVGTFVAWWLANDAAVKVRPATLHTYSKECARITEGLGTVPLAGLTAEHVRGFLAGLRRQGLAASTVGNVRTRLRQVIAAAVDAEYLTRNPVSSVPAPKATAEERTTRRVLTEDETRRLLAALEPDRPLDAVVAMLFTSGVRVSEALGLAWEDLDLDAATATITRSATYTGGGVGTRLDKCKTTATAGVHPLAPTVVALLRGRRRRQAEDRLRAGDLWPTTTYEGRILSPVFTTEAGGLQVRQRVTKAIRSACGRAGIDPTGVGTHSGRRTVITRLTVAGVPLDDVARHVGHTSTDTTARYVHDLGERPRDVARQAHALLDPAANDH